MKRTSVVALAVALIFGGVAWQPANANPIERACVQSDRPNANRTICRCIGEAADVTLSRDDMRQGARFFSDPAYAQRIQLSDTRRDDAFWSRWQQFAQAAENRCS